MNFKFVTRFRGIEDGIDSYPETSKKAEAYTKNKAWSRKQSGIPVFAAKLGRRARFVCGSLFGCHPKVFYGWDRQEIRWIG